MHKYQFFPIFVFIIITNNKGPFSSNLDMNKLIVLAQTEYKQV